MLIRLSFSLSFSLLVKGRLLVIYVEHHLLWPGSSRQDFATGFLRYLLQLVYISTHRSSFSLSSTITRRHTRQPILPSAIPAFFISLVLFRSVVLFNVYISAFPPFLDSGFLFVHFLYLSVLPLSQFGCKFDLRTSLLLFIVCPFRTSSLLSIVYLLLFSNTTAFPSFPRFIRTVFHSDVNTSPAANLVEISLFIHPFLFTLQILIDITITTHLLSEFQQFPLLALDGAKFGIAERYRFCACNISVM